MKKFILLVSILLATLFFTLCLLICCIPTPETERRYEEHLYWKEVDCVIEDTDIEYWGIGHIAGTVKVYNSEYDLREEFDIYGRDAMELRDKSEGDIVKCEMYSWVNVDTGEVVRRQLNNINY